MTEAKRLLLAVADGLEEIVEANDSQGTHSSMVLHNIMTTLHIMAGVIKGIVETDENGDEVAKVE